MWIPILVAMPATTLIPPIEGSEGVVNRIAKLVGRDLLNDLLTVIDPVLDSAVAKLLKEGSKPSSVARRIRGSISCFIHAAGMRLVARVLKGQISASDARSLCREAVHVLGTRYGRRVCPALGLGIAALYDFDLEILHLLPQLGVPRFHSLARSRLREEYPQLLEVLNDLATMIVLLTRSYLTNAERCREMASRIESELSKLVDLVEAHLDTMAIAMDPANEELARKLLRS